MYRNGTLLGLARLAPCCMSCGAHNHGQVVAAHRNETKAMGSKCPDYMWAGLCDKCHVFLDHGAALTRDDRRAMWNAAYWKTQDWLWNHGHLVVSIEPQAPPPQPVKRKAKIPTRKMQSRPFPVSAVPQKIASRPFAKAKP